MKPSRINIKYDIETENGTEQKELPFVVGILSDLSGNAPAQIKSSIKQRKFIDIDLQSINSVMQSISPGVKVNINNEIIQLYFNSIQDFDACNIAKQVPSLNKLLIIKQQLRDLLSKVTNLSNN